MSHSLCERCEHGFSCLLNFDGKPCRKLRSVEPTNYDRIKEMDVDRLAHFLTGIDPSMSLRYWTDWLKSEAKETFV